MNPRWWPRTIPLGLAQRGCNPSVPARVARCYNLVEVRLFLRQSGNKPVLDHHRFESGQWKTALADSTVDEYGFFMELTKGASPTVLFDDSSVPLGEASHSSVMSGCPFQEHYCSAATQLIMSQLYPHIFGSAKTHGTLVGTCVSGDLHEIGVRILCDFFEMQGWHSHYLGANVPTSSVVQTVLQLKADVLAISATITYHVDAVEKLIAAIRSTPECRNIKVLVGGYPFKVAPNLWQTIGADGSANNAEDAVIEANRLTCQSFVA